MRRTSLLLAQFGSFVMIFVTAYFALGTLFTGGFWVALGTGVGGVIYWTAMFHVFGAVNDYLTEKKEREDDPRERGLAKGAPPIPWMPGMGPPDLGEPGEETAPLDGEGDAKLDPPDPLGSPGAPEHPNSSKSWDGRD